MPLRGTREHCRSLESRVPRRGTRPLSGSISMLKSSVGAEWVSAPTEIRSTPVSAIPRTVSRLTPPEASSEGPLPVAGSRRAARPPRAGSRGPCCRAGARRRRCRARRRPRRGRGTRPRPRRSGSPLRARVHGLGEAAGEGDVVLLDQDRVVEAHAVVAPAAGEHRRLLQRRAAPASSCACRGSRAPVPATASTKRAVSVATPERWPRKLSAVRSAASSAAARAAGEERPRPGPPRATGPRRRALSTSSTPHWRIVSATTSRPKTTPGCFCTIRARPRAPSGTVASAVTSPAPMSSASARATISEAPRHRRTLSRS